MTRTSVRTVKLPSGEAIPALGQGTWHMGEHAERRDDELASLRLGIELGMTLIDTAEMYGDGAAEELISEAVAGRRDEMFLVSKVLPHHASLRDTVNACEKSLQRLRSEHLDLYLLHWRGALPLEGTIAAFEGLIRSGKIRYWGVSNFDVPDLEELHQLDDGANAAANQVLYNLKRRGIEFDLLPWCCDHSIPIMAYSPIEQGKLAGQSALAEVAARHNVTPAQVALAWVLRQDGVIAIPKAGRPEHVRENRAALDLRLADRDLNELDRAFPPPTQKMPLEMI